MSESKTTDEYIDELDQETVLEVDIYGHTNQYVYRFPSGIMTTVWGDDSVRDGSIGLMSEDHVRDVLDKYDIVGPIPFSESPYAAEWDENE